MKNNDQYGVQDDRFIISISYNNINRYVVYAPVNIHQSSHLHYVNYHPIGTV